MAGQSSSGACGSVAHIMHAPVEALLCKDSYVGHTDPVTFVHFDPLALGPTEAEHVVTLVWLPGHKQRPDNELLRRLVNAFHECGARKPQRLVVMALRSEQDAVEGAVRRAPGNVFLGGHSQGGGDACAMCFDLRDRYPIIVGYVAVNPWCEAEKYEPGVPALIVRGENDDGGNVWGRLLPDGQWPSDDQMAFPSSEGTTTTLIARQGCHSIRYMPDPSADKDAQSITPQTRKQNFEVAAQMLRFMGVAELGGKA